MGTTIFYTESKQLDRRLELNKDGTLTYYEETAMGWKMMREGLNAKEETMTPEEAKRRWPGLSDKIDEELSKL